jgi:hypothetical protein
MCGHRAFRELQLVREDGATVPLGRLKATLNRTWALRMLGEDGRFWDNDNQLTFTPHAEGWFLVPNPGAPNETLVNGTTATTSVDVRDGMVIGVGRAARGIVKTPFTTRLV